MTDFNKLEQLNRLRESGALTEQEFADEKAKLLNHAGPVDVRNRRWLLLAGALVLSLSLAALVVSAFIPKPTADPETKLAVGTATTSGQIAASGSAENLRPLNPIGAASEASLSWAMGPAVIGLNPVFVESKLGPAKEKGASYWVFEVKGCTVSYDVEGDAIVAAGMPVSARCTPQVDGRTITSSTTFAEVRGPTSTVRASCISGCGNAYDPTIDLHQDGYHANGFIEILYSSNYGDPQSVATERWRRSIRVAHGLSADGYGNEGSGWFECVSRPPTDVLAALGPETIGYVRIGRGLDRDGSCRFG